MAPGGYTEYRSSVPQQDHMDDEGHNQGGVHFFDSDIAVHTMPSVLKKKVDIEPFPYAVRLPQIQATCLRGKLPVGGDEVVFLPYRPVGMHG